jgi:hypothetical protein
MLSGVKAIGTGVKEYFTPSGHITKALQQAGSRVPVLKSRALEAIAQAYGAEPELRQAATLLGLDVENMSPALLSKNPQAQSVYFGVQSAKGSKTGMQIASGPRRTPRRERTFRGCADHRPTRPEEAAPARPADK